MRRPLAAALTAALLGACSAGPTLEPVNEEAAPPRPSPQPEPPSPAPVPAPAPAPPGEGEVAPSQTPRTGPLESDGQTVVIDDAAGEAGRQRSLAEVAADERNRRAASGPPMVVIDNESLKDYEHIEITVSDIRAQAQADEPAAGQAAESGSQPDLEELARREAHWRAQVLEARTRWREAYDSIERLEGRIAELRRAFYAEDDPYYRDSQIKTAWDYAIVQLEEAREEVTRAQADLDQRLEAGRVAGAFPGWLREGIEMEPPRGPAPDPENRQTEEAGIYEPEEPQPNGARDPEDGRP